MMKRTLTAATVALLGFGVTATMAQPKAPRVVPYKFFDDQYRQGGFDYAYGGKSKGITITKEGGYKSKAALNIKLDPSEYSGASVCLYNETFDLSKFLLDSKLEFMIKGKKGGESVKVGLLDEEVSDGKKTQVVLPMNKYIEGGAITTEWKKVSIPLVDFPDRGLYWDNTRKSEFPARIDWDKIAEIRFSIDKSGAKDFEVWVDNIEIVKGNKKAKPKPKIVYWDENNDVINGPKNPEKLDGKVKPVANGVFYSDGLKGFSYSYGGLSAQREADSKTAGNKNVLALYIDNNDWSGVTYSLGEGKYIDLSKVRNKGGLYFWIKGKLGGEKVYVGILDNQGNDIKSQTKISLNDWIEGSKVGTDWKLVKIPLKKFNDKGKAWDANKQAEVAKDVQWNKIQEIRFSVGKGENAGEPGKPAPVTIFVDQITFTETIDWVDPDIKWDNWKSKAPDMVISDFEGKFAKDNWEPSKGPKSKVEVEMPFKTSKLDGNSLNVKHFEMSDWVDVVLDFTKNTAAHDANGRDWTKHWGIMFDVYSERAWQSITVQVGDAGNELFVANTGVPRGRTTVIVPFRAFSKFPYYQPPTAKENGQFDLKGVVSLDFKPGGEGSNGSFEIDNIKLTNQKEVKAAERPALVKVEVKGTGDVINPNISGGLFGINAALWDGDMLDNPKFKVQTAEYAKRINHGIIRYPGGLRADDDHWKEILDNHDWMVDTDEFLAWLKKTGSNAMFTVNFGSGTEQEAAAWVKHTNIDKKAGIVYWEIGNEVYGNWHPYYEKYGKDGGTIYGKRARKFIEAMKKVDPTIKVAVLGVLDGQWNDNVLKETGDIADGLIVHHYPQHFGEENDFAMLSAPQDLVPIYSRLHKVVDKWTSHFNKDKKIELWLTEWNSVDFNPGPQTISLENGLFVADYLAMLATENVDNAQYWDIHNDITPEGGDYGYLTRSAEECMNCPRPSYWAFQMASDALRGKLLKTEITGDKESLITTYYTENGKKKSLLVINKSPYSDYELKLNIPGFKGKATVQTLDRSTEKLKEGWANDPSKKAKKGVDVSKPIKVGKRTVTLITVE
ncbi:MAG: carbohydrate-binding protein [Fibrobacter sp.]|nr:carbohydrate-binding protein [Fibrobacter sp.]